MNYINCHVKLLLNNNIIVEGVVQEWSTDSVKLLSLDKKSISIITHPNEDIRVIKIINDNIIKNNSELEKEIKETYEQPSNDLRLKSLVELKKELIRQEKEIVASKLNTHNIGEVKEVKYEQPRFFKKQGAE